MQKTFQVFKLRFGKTPLHLSKGKIDYDQSLRIIHSDTLKSAIFVCALQLYGKEEITEDFFKSFCVSSAFPFWGEEYFFPKPMCKTAQIAELEDTKQGKKIKKIAFLGKSYFENLLIGDLTEIQQNHILSGGGFVSKHEELHKYKNSLESKKEKFNLISSEIQERVSIPRMGEDEDPQPYYVERLFFDEYGGLFFLTDIGKDSDTYKKVKASLELLADTGVGTDKNVGNGQFILDTSEIKLEMPEDSNKQINLSLYCPQESELSEDFLNASNYNLLKRGGWVASPENDDDTRYRKKSIYMFAESSVFPNKDLKGKIVDVVPDAMKNTHPIWKDGQALFININAQENDIP
jgi:CRISPR-associated protein Csm4